MRNAKRYAALIAALALLLCALPGSAMAATGIVTADSLNLREEPWSEGNWLGTYQAGAQVTIVGEENGWYQVIAPDGKSGYMSSAYVSVGQEAAETQGNYIEVGSVQQYGRADTRTYAAGLLSFSVAYPRLDSTQADNALRRWINSLLYSAQESDAWQQIEVLYNSYWVQGRYIGVLEMGGKKLLGVPEEPVMYALNVDTWNDRLLTYEDIFVAEGIPAVLEMMRGMLEAAGETPARILTREALRYTVLTNDGAVVYIPETGNLGATVLVLTYSALLEDGLLALEMDVPADQAVPAATQQPADGPMVALTFDDGPSEYTLKILDVLAAYDVKATFFIVGNRANNFRDILARTAQEGHEIATHTWSHKDLTKLSGENARLEVQRGLDAIAAVTDSTVTLLRPPYGAVDSQVRSVARELGLTIALWNVDTEDWRTDSASSTIEVVLSEAENGSIVLCHDLKESTPEAVETIVPALIAQGYRLVTVSELLSYSQTERAPGVVFTHLDASHLTTP